MTASRRDPRPQYYNAQSGSWLTISYEFETYCLQLNDAGRASLISRLRKSTQTTAKNSVRDDLAYQALDHMASQAGAACQELGVTLGEFQGFQQDVLASPAGEIGEVSQMLRDCTTGFAEPAFRYAEERYNLVYSSLKRDALKSGDNTDEVRRELASWIDVISLYM